MATYEKRGKYWRAKIKRKLPDGTIFSKSATRDTKKEAQQWAMAVEAQVLGGEILSTASNHTKLGELIERYEKDIVPAKKSATSLVYRCRLLNKHLGHLMLYNLNSMMVAQYRDMRRKSVSASSINQEMQLLKSILDLSDREWGIPLKAGNPVSRVRKCSLPRGRDRRLLPGELERLLDEAGRYGGALQHIIRFAIQTAMRRGEIAKMHWKDVDLEHRLLRIPDTKNGEPRTIPLTHEAVDILRSLPKIADSDSVWNITPDAISRAFIRIRDRAGIVDLRLHDLRHEAVSQLFELGMNPIQVASISGHKDMQMLKRYTHIRPETLFQFLDSKSGSSI